MSGGVLDLSQLPAPQLLPADYEEIRSERMERLKELFSAAGIPFDVETLEANPAAVIQQQDAFREVLALTAVNDTYRGTLLAFATGAQIDQIAATWHGLSRQERETDARFRQRITLESRAKAGGQLDGYRARALEADPRVAAASASVDREGRIPAVRLWIATEAGPADVELVQAVQAYLDRDDIRQATDVVTVASVTMVPVTIRGHLEHLIGPDPTVIKTEALAELQKVIARRAAPGRDLPRSAVLAALSVNAVERAVLEEPAADVLVGPGGLLRVDEITLTTEIVDG